MSTITDSWLFLALFLSITASVDVSFLSGNEARLSAKSPLLSRTSSRRFLEVFVAAVAMALVDELF